MPEVPYQRSRSLSLVATKFRVIFLHRFLKVIGVFQPNHLFVFLDVIRSLTVKQKNGDEHEKEPVLDHP